MASEAVSASDQPVPEGRRRREASPRGDVARADPGAERMVAFARGDEEAFDEIVELYREAVMRFISRRVRDPNRAEDLVQETFLRVYRAKETYRPTASFKSWLFTIAHRLSLNELRSERRRAKIFAPIAGSAPDSAGGERRAEDLFSAVSDPRSRSPEEAMEFEEFESELRRELARLPLAQRTAIELVSAEGLSYAEAGRVMGVTVAAVRSLLMRGRRALLEKLSPERIKKARSEWGGPLGAHCEDGET